MNCVRLWKRRSARRTRFIASLQFFCFSRGMMEILEEAGQTSQLHVFKKCARFVPANAGFLCIGQHVVFLAGVHLFDELAPRGINAARRGLADLVEEAGHIQQLQFIAQGLVLFYGKGALNIVLDGVDGLAHGSRLEKGQDIPDDRLVYDMYQRQRHKAVAFLLRIAVKRRPEEGQEGHRHRMLPDIPRPEARHAIHPGDVENVHQEIQVGILRDVAQHSLRGKDVLVVDMFVHVPLSFMSPSPGTAIGTPSLARSAYYQKRSKTEPYWSRNIAWKQKLR